MRRASGVVLVTLLVGSMCAAGDVIIDFKSGYDLSSIERNDVKVKLARKRALRIESSHNIDWPGITIKAPEGKWDLSKYVAVAMDVHNPGDDEVYIGLRIDNPGGDGGRNCSQKVFRIGPGERRTVKTEMTRRMPEDVQMFGMRGFPPVVRG